MLFELREVIEFDSIKESETLSVAWYLFISAIFSLLTDVVMIL